jgi:N-hydroxyarylamine O-acetyltransferase
MNLQKYLDRINYTGKTKVSIDTLRDLHKKHMYSVPFENIDIHTGKKIELNTEKFEEKIINGRRGGFCYELNGLFYELLKSLGFDVMMVSARVYDENEIPGAEFDHLVLIVKIDGEEYLADVGFGDSFIEPQWMNLDFVNEDPAGFFQIVKEDDENLKLMRSEDGVYFTPKYIFSKEARALSDFDKMCAYHQTSSKSHFTKNKLCSLPNEKGRVTLVNNKLIITKNNKKEEIAVHGEKEFNENLKKYFSIEI